jgi:hypothetical protein
MRSSRMGVIGLIIVSWLLIGSVGAWAEGPEFSADQFLNGPAGPEQTRLYCKVDRWRLDFTREGREIIHISRGDKKITWMLIPKDMVYVELPLFSETIPWADKMPGEVERRSLGEEAINDHPCLKYQVKLSNGESTQEFILWISKELKVPVKTASPDGKFGTELKNIQIGPQPDQLFELPAGFKQISPPLHG